MRPKPFTPFFVTWYCHDVPKELLEERGGDWRGKDVLEAGCGGGSLLFHLADSAHSVHGVDISESAIDFLDRTFAGQYTNLTVGACDFAEFDTERRFDLVISNDCFEHVENGDGFVRTASRLLTPAGRFLLQFPNELDHGINHFPTFGDLDGLMRRYFGKVEYFEIRPSAWHELLHRVFSGIRTLAAPGLARNRSQVLADPETQGLDDFARSSCFTWIQGERKGGLKFSAARAVNRVFRLLDRMGPGHRARRLDPDDPAASILDRRLVVLAQDPTSASPST